MLVHGVYVFVLLQNKMQKKIQVPVRVEQELMVVRSADVNSDEESSHNLIP